MSRQSDAAPAVLAALASGAVDVLDDLDAVPVRRRAGDRDWSSSEVRGIYENLAAASGLTAAPFIPMVPAQPGHLASVAS